MRRSSSRFPKGRFAGHRRIAAKSSAARLLLLAAALFLTLCAQLVFARKPQPPRPVPPQAPPQSQDTPVPASSPFVDVHTHLDPTDINASVQIALEMKKKENAAKIFFLASPSVFSMAPKDRFDSELLLAAIKKYPGEFGVLGGGGTLNAIIQQAVESGDAGPAVQAKFKQRAEEIILQGALGFGEMTAEHFPTSTPYQYAPADHPLFLMLADIAAEHNVPIDLHMEAVPQDMPLPSHLKSPPNPPRLHANIANFERLLAHNPRAKIIWDHAGWDNTGYRTPELCRRLLQAHANLYMELKLDAQDTEMNPPLANGATGPLKPDWLKLLQDFPDRFIIGSDQHYPMPKQAGTQRWQEIVLLFNQLPPDLRRKIGTENAARIYNLKSK
jgi:predicted TIM-barrel fold metal-dependent hydrolase